MEAGGHAGRLVDYLSRHFGRGSVFRDIDTIRRGEDFAQAIESALNACDVVLVVIGKYLGHEHGARWSLPAGRPEGLGSARSRGRFASQHSRDPRIS
jgi:hypothetical protein